MPLSEPSRRPPNPYVMPRGRKPARGRRVAIVRGQDKSRWTDAYHAVLIAPWSVFFLGVTLYFVIVNALFAGLYLLDPGGLEHARHGSFWDAFLFSVQTLGAINYSVMIPKSVYANVVVTGETFFGILNLALITGIMYARFSRPFARIIFSRNAVIVPFDGVPTLMFRAANQRGNQILDASVTLSYAREAMTKEGHVMRRFEELKLVRSRTPLFALSWTVLHQIDEASPLYGQTLESLQDCAAELSVLFSGTDETLADVIYARHSFLPEDIQWNRRFVDVLSVSPNGRRVVDLRKFHDTEPLIRMDAAD